MNISRDEWLAALGDAAQPADPDALTSDDISALLGLGRTATRDRLRRLVQDGKATRSWKWAEDNAGRRYRVPAYRLVKGKKK